MRHSFAYRAFTQGWDLMYYGYDIGHDMRVRIGCFDTQMRANIGAGTVVTEER